MRRIGGYMWQNRKRVFEVLLSSVVFSIWIVPQLIRVNFIARSMTSTQGFVGLLGLIVLLALLSRDKAQSLWQRYRNTHELENVAFLYPDGIALFLLFSGLWVRFFEWDAVQRVFDDYDLFAGGIIALWLVGLIGITFWSHRGESRDSRGRKREQVSSTGQHSLFDEPIRMEREDLLGRAGFVDRLFREVAYLPLPDCFVFGLYGGWGEGKTSVINLLSERVRMRDSFLIVNFNPWRFDNKEAMAAGFYTQIEAALSRDLIIPGLKTSFARYMRMLSLALPGSGLRLDLWSRQESPEEMKERLESYIEGTGKRLVVFVDDLDRLHDREIQQILSLISLGGRFRNTRFVLSFDPIEVLRKLRLADEGLPSDFLEKIVQKPISLPAIEQRDVDDYLDYHFGLLFDGLGIAGEERKHLEDEFPGLYGTTLVKFFRTLRNAKRYLNGLRSTLPAIWHEVDLVDFMLLEVLSVFHPKVYEDIRWNPWFYIELDLLDKGYLQSLAIAKGGKVPEESVKDHIHRICVGEKREPGLLEELLSYLFPDQVGRAVAGRPSPRSPRASARAEKRIESPGCFWKYFAFRVPRGEVSDEFVEKTVVGWGSCPEGKEGGAVGETILEIQGHGLLVDFMRKLTLFANEISLPVVRTLIDYIRGNAVIFSREGEASIRGSERDAAKYLLLSLVNCVRDKGETTGILDRIVSDTGDLAFTVGIVDGLARWPRYPLRDILDSGGVDRWEKALGQRLEDHFVREGRDIFKEYPGDWLSILRNWARFEGQGTEAKRTERTDWVCGLSKADPPRFVRFLSGFKEPILAGPNWTIDFRALKNVCSIGRIAQMAKVFVADPRLSNEEKGTIQYFLTLYDSMEAGSA